ncbi:MAG: hypothetical protein ACSLFD_00390 [Solirubrobacterales bacterium]
MTFAEVLEISLYFALFVFVVLCGTSLLVRLLRRKKGAGWRAIVTSPGRFVAIRAGVALGFGCLLLVLVSAALTLNQHRPPDEQPPVLSVSGSGGRTAVKVDLDECGDSATGTVQVSGVRSGSSAVTIQSERDTAIPVALDEDGVGTFTLTEPSTKRSLLSCYVQMPVVTGGAGSSVSLVLGDGMEIDAFDSVPSPSGYLNGRWVWECPAGETCGVLATAGLAVENGAQQVIVLVLAAIFGAVLALFIGELLIEPVRRRLDNLKKD